MLWVFFAFGYYVSHLAYQFARIIMVVEMFLFPRSQCSKQLVFVHNLISDKDKLRSESPQKFLGMISFLCQIYGRLRHPAGEPFKPLTDSVMESLEMLLDEKATDEEMLCAAEQVNSVVNIPKVAITTTDSTVSHRRLCCRFRSHQV